MKFLLTNDDGHDAPGIASLVRAIDALGTWISIAPDRHLSGCSHQTTTDRPLMLETIAPQQYALDGTPADCARLGLLHLAQDVDWVLSGINDGGNLGCDVFMSGTVAAVREAALWGKPGIAISHYRRRGMTIDWEWAARQTRRAIEWILSQPMEVGMYWNVNLPHRVDAADPELVECPLDPHPLAFEYEQREGVWHFRGNYQGRRQQPGHDVEQCFGGSITITQLRLKH